MEILSNPYVIAAVIVAAVVIVVKMIDQRRDARQKVYQDIADQFALFGQDGFASAFKALARDGYEEFYTQLKGLAERLRAPGGVAEVLTTIIIKSLRDQDFMRNEQVKARLQPVLAEIVLGFMLDDKTQSELTLLSPKLAQYGSVEIAQFFAALGANNVDGAKAAAQALIATLRDPEKIDDVLMERAKKAIPELMKDPAHAAALRVLVPAA